MNQKLIEVLNNQGDNYILPFFWQHGEDEAILREEMEKIDACGIGAVCVEARPHPDFAGPLWWRDLDIILDEAQKRDMKVWILDDAHFPTGFANDILKEKPIHLRKQYLMFKNTDVAGPLAGARLDVGSLAQTVPMPALAPSTPFGAPKDQLVFTDDSLLAVVAGRILPGDKLDPVSLLDLTARVVDGVLTWDVPAGVWRVFILYLTRNGGGNTNYINMLDRASCALQIEAVYEPHYARYADDFGKTIAGFFSDEPLVGNTIGFNFDEVIGKKMMPLPWSAEMPDLMRDALGDNWMLYLPFLWFAGPETDSCAAHVRYAFMDIVTRLIEKNFSRQIGEWCAARGIEYIGHLIEDNNQHSRLGSSLGHFFRGLAGQHMSGIDDIGGQVLPGMENTLRHRRILQPGDGEFFHFALGKLGSSYGHIDPIKKGRTMCEIFGAYGWGEGVRMMKWLTDHFLVRGVNHYVPHAFSPKEFPDEDCPPHFYARGNNPQYRHFGHLMRYMNRMCHLLNDGRAIAPAAILYHAESEWTGETMLMQKPARVLAENQIDFDFLPSDVFSDRQTYQMSLSNGWLIVNQNTYRCLIVPTAEYIHSTVAEFAVQAMGEGFPVIFINKLPQGVSDGMISGKTLPENLRFCPVTTLAELPDLLDKFGIRDIVLDRPFPFLRYLHYRTGSDTFMFFNESLSDRVDTWIYLPVAGPAAFYDGEENKLYHALIRPEGKGSKVRVVLEPYESCVLVFGQEIPSDLPVRKPLSMLKPVLEINGPWQISLATAKEYPDFKNRRETAVLYDISIERPNFSGTVRYETAVEVQTETGQEHVLLLEEANEAVEVWVNDTYAGIRLCPPYRFPVGELLVTGRNTLRIEVTNTLENQMRGKVSPATSILHAPGFTLPVGLTGKVEIYSADAG
ncbi:MAG: glycoside hydrolase family 2 [Saccharofermentanales bacterium]